MALTAEQIAEARSEGYTDAEILQHYAASQGIDLKAAKDEGYSDSEILSHISGADIAPQEKEVVGTPQDAGTLTNPELTATLGAGAGAVYSAKTIPVKAARALGTAFADRMPKAPTTPSPSMYTTPSGINVEQTPGGLHPGAVGNAQFNIEQQQANALRQNMPSGFEQRGTSRIITPVGMQEPAAALGGARQPSAGMGSVMQNAAKKAAPVVGGSLRTAATSNPVAGAMAGYNLQQGLNRYREGDVGGAAIGGAGTVASLLPKMKGRAGLIKPIVGGGAALLNAVRDIPAAIPHYAGGGKTDLLFQAIKSAKQLAREAGYVHDVVPTHKFSTPKQISIQDLQGKTLVGVPGDRTLTGHEVRAVNRVPLSKPVEQQGGPMYGLRQQDLGNPYFWASNDAAAIGLQNKARRAQQQYGNDVFGLYTAMAPNAGNYALHTTETLLNQIPAMNPRKKDIAAFDKIIRERYPSFAGVTDPDVLEQLARDSKMRKFLAERLNKTTVAEQYGMPSGEATIHAITEPALRNVPVGNTGFTVGKLHPEKELTPNIDVTHGTYNTNIPGEFQGQMIAQLPWQMYFPEAAAKIASNPRQAGPNAWGTFKMGDFNQPVTQELVDKIAPLEEAILAGKQNKAEGGVVNMEKGGLAALAKKALRKYGVGLGLTAPFATEAGQEATKGNYGSMADLASGFLPAPAMAAYMSLSPSETAPMHMDQYPGRQGTDPLAGTGSVMQGYVPGMAAGGDALKALKKLAGVGSRTIEGSPHTYPPIAEGPWMRDYQPATRPEPGFKFPVLEAGAPTDQPYLVKQGSTYTAANVPMPSEQRIQQMGLKNALATQTHPALREAQDRSILALMDQKRMNYIQNILKSDPSTSMEELLQMYPRYETWMR